ncbi:MAG: SUF system NifU family Fe-S cluster assembly protein [Elusimicrobia bacterium]|nr:SUF system NifU family Fe-S cluster assembly protein [Elusimicrobiota bacterium]
MDDIRSLYQEVILDHSKNPRNFRKLEGKIQSAEGFNPLCGDQITIYLQLEEDRIKEITFQGSGCAISKASASLMTIQLEQKTRSEVESLFQKFHNMVTSPSGSNSDFQDLGKLAALSGVSEFPMRVKCATLAWHTLKAALQSKTETVSTE